MLNTYRIRDVIDCIRIYDETGIVEKINPNGGRYDPTRSRLSRCFSDLEFIDSSSLKSMNNKLSKMYDQMELDLKIDGKTLTEKMMEEKESMSEMIGVFYNALVFNKITKIRQLSSSYKIQYETDEIVGKLFAWGISPEETIGIDISTIKKDKHFKTEYDDIRLSFYQKYLNVRDNIIADKMLYINLRIGDWNLQSVGNEQTIRHLNRIDDIMFKLNKLDEDRLPKKEIVTAEPELVLF